MAIKLSSNSPRVVLDLSREHFDMIQRFAHRSGASVHQVMIAGALNLITAIEKGEIMPEALSEYRTGIRPGNA